MARIKFSAFVSEIRGTVAGTTFQKNKYGYTVKNRPNMVRPRSSRQFINQIDFTWAQRQWALLTETNRAAWNSWAEEFPQYAKNNPEAQLNGYNVFARNQYFRKLANLGLLTEPNPVPIEPPTYEDTFVIYNDTNEDIQVTTPTFSATDAYWMLFFASAPVKGSKSFLNTNTRFMFANALVSATVIPFTDQYLSAFGQLPPFGSKIHIRCIGFDQDSGNFVTFIDGFAQVEEL